MLIKTAEITHMKKIANALEKNGCYEEAEYFDGLIKQAGIWGDAFKKIWDYISALGVQKVVDNITNNPNSLIAQWIKKFVNKTDNVTVDDVQGMLNKNRDYIEQVETEEPPVETGGAVEPEQQEDKIVDDSKEAVVADAITNGKSLYIKYTRKDGGTREYNIYPKELMPAGLRQGKTYEKTLWANKQDDPTGKVHSYVFDKVEILKKS